MGLIFHKKWQIDKRICSETKKKTCMHVFCLLLKALQQCRYACRQGVVVCHCNLL